MQCNGHITDILITIILIRFGGDCTNFVSQCIYAGSNVMNYDKNNGWYYNNTNDRAPSWSGVEFLYNFLTKNKGIRTIWKKCKCRRNYKWRYSTA